MVSCFISRFSPSSVPREADANLTLDSQVPYEIHTRKNTSKNGHCKFDVELCQVRWLALRTNETDSYS